MLPSHHPPRRHGAAVANSANASPADLYAQGVRRRSSIPLSAVLEMGDYNEDDDEVIPTKDTDALLGRQTSSSSSSSGPRRRSSAIAGRGTTSPSDHQEPTPLVGSYLLYTTVLITVLLGPQLGWEIAQLNLGIFHNAKDCAQHPVTTGRCIMFPGHSNAEWVMAVMFWVLGASVGSLGSSIPADKYGRRFVVMGNAALMILGGLLQTFAPSIFLFALGRFFNGLASGSGSTIASVFLSEIGPPAQKAGFVVAFQGTGSLGLVSITIIHFVVTGSPTSWRWIMAFPAILGLIQLAMAPLFLIESPKWLLVNRRPGEAAAAFHMLYKAGSFHDLEQTVKTETERNVRRQILEAQASSSSSTHHKSFLQEALSSRSSKQFIISCILCMARQFGGVSAVFYYSSSIFSEAGIADARIGNVLLSVVNMIAVFMICFYMKKLPRRTMLLTGIGGMICCSIGMTIALINKSGMAVILTAMYVGFNSLSLSPLPFLVTAEVLPEHIKTKGVSITTFINWFCNLIVGTCFPIVAHYTGNYTFLPFTCLLVIFWICVYGLLPETKNKTVEQIQTEFHQQTGFFAKFQKKSMDESGKDALATAKEEELNSGNGNVAAGTNTSSAAAALASSRRTSVEFVMPSQPIRPALSRSA